MNKLEKQQGVKSVFDNINQYDGDKQLDGMIEQAKIGSTVMDKDLDRWDQVVNNL